MQINMKTAMSITLDIIKCYLDQDVDAVFKYMDEKTIFIGPRTGQFLTSGTKIRNASLSDAPSPEFSVENIRTFALPVTSNSCEIICMYTVIWKKKDGTIIRHPQTLQVTYVLRPSMQTDEDKSLAYRIICVHISNPMEPDERDLHYKTFGDMSTSRIGALPGKKIAEAGGRIIIPGLYGSVYTYPSAALVWIESASGGHQSVVHTRSQELRCSKPLSYFSKNYPEVFLKPSVSYMVNPLYIREIRRCEAELWNGTVLRVPEKKFTAFKKEYLELTKSEK
ncbi:MAG: LytTR family DNA-binding domain-containing protein [Eubacterium sp.]